MGKWTEKPGKGNKPPKPPDPLNIYSGIAKISIIGSFRIISIIIKEN